MEKQPWRFRGENERLRTEQERKRNGFVLREGFSESEHNIHTAFKVAYLESVLAPRKIW